MKKRVFKLLLVLALCLALLPVAIRAVRAEECEGEHDWAVSVDETTHTYM